MRLKFPGDKNNEQIDTNDSYNIDRRNGIPCLKNNTSINTKTECT